MASKVNGVNGNHTEMSYMSTRNQPEVREPSGYANGSISSSKYRFDQSSFRRSESHSTTASYSTEQQITVLKETVNATCVRFVADLDDVDDHYIHHTTMEDFLEFIERERLTHMPHRGSHWDKVLKWAEFFSLQVSGYANTVDSFIADSKLAARLIWTACRALLQLGPSNAQALETTFSVFYKLGLSISLLLRRNTLLTATEYLRREVGYALNDLLLLVRDVSLYYRARLLGSGQDTSFDFNTVFGHQVSAFDQRKAGIVNSMWEHALGHQALAQMRTVRKWLQPSDRASRKLLGGNEIKAGSRAEFTCEWFQSHLLAFTRSRDDVLAIQGPAGCGKSVLAGWIVERLQRPLGKKTHDTLSCTIEPDVTGEASSLAVVKRLVLQLLEKNVGDKNLYHGLVEARRHATSKDAESLEKSLWNCIDTSLEQYQGTECLMIIVDGLDGLEGGQQHITKMINQLASIASKHGNVQAILSSRGSASKPSQGKMRDFAITSGHTHEDLRLVIDGLFEHYQPIGHLNEHAREKIVEQLLHAAKGNFLWAILTTFLVKRESTYEGFDKALKHAVEALKNVDETIAKLMSTMDLAKPDVHLLLSWMLLSSRPFTIGEIRLLYNVDLARKTFVERDMTTINDALAVLSPFVAQQDGFVRFRHSLIRQYMVNIQTEGKRLRNKRDAQTELTMRLLAYCHFHLTKINDPTFDMMEDSDIQKLFTKFALLDYVVSNWLYHFRSSSLYQTNGSLQLTSEFKSIFPASSQLPLLEYGCWDAAATSTHITHSYDLALRIRQEVLTQNHRSVLQGLIVCGNALRNRGQVAEAGAYFYRASKVSQQVLRKRHTFTIHCSTTFLTVIESLKITSRSETATMKEETLIYIIETYKHQHGKTHDLVIRYYKTLAQLYVDIHEEHKAETVWRELQEIMIVRFGKGSKEETSISEQLTIVLKKDDKKKDITEYANGIFDVVSELEIWDIRRIRMTIELAKSYEEHGEFLRAEELLVMLWRRLTEQCHHSHHHHGVDIHIRTIDIVIEYVHFLRRRKRHEEAANVLICIWAEYEEFDFESETIFLKLKVIGQLMREISLLHIAVSVFKKCWGWFKSHGKHEHSTSCEILISETTVEIVTSVSTNSTMTSTTTSISTEVVIREVFESTLTRSTVTTETISICKNLISFYMKLEQWSEAIEVTKRSLLIIWKSIVSGSGMIALPKDFGSEAIDIAIYLAICHERSHHYHEAEEIYLRVYHACRNSCRIDDERLIRTHAILIKFYEENRNWQKMIQIHREILDEYRTHLGAKHSLTIRTLYILGSLCLEHGHGNGYEFYEEIITILNQGSHVCHVDALEAMMIICRWRYQAGHWHKLRNVCKILWETWRDRHAGHEKFTAEFVEVLYIRYRYVLEHHVQCEYSVIRELTIEYRNACLKSFGVTVSVTIKAMIELAHICMKSEKYVSEAISLYEEVLTHIESTKKQTTATIITETSITEVRQRLTKAYIQVCSHESVSIQTIERAVKVISERYRFLQVTFGWAHIETLTVLRELVLMQLRMKKQESVSVVTRILLEATVEIITREKHSKTLHEAGKFVGQIFRSCGLTSYAHDMIHELRLHIITGSTTSNNKLGIKLDKAVGRVSFVFLVTLEQVIRENLSISYTEVMADYITESVLYESYTRSLNSSTTVMIGHAARLRAFLHRHKRQSQITVVEDQSFEIFIKKWSLNGQQHIRKLFYISLLEQIGENVREIVIGDVACRSTATKVAVLLGHDRVQEAYEVTLCAHQFLTHQHSFHKLENVTYGFKLSGLMVGLGLNKPVRGNIDPQLQQKMRQLSQDIIREVLKACKEAKIDFVRLRLSDLNGLIALLGEQRNYADLGWILEILWKSREVQKNWKPNTIIQIGRRFVQARYLNASKERRSEATEAIRLCEDICYNLRRVWGSHPETLKMSDLLSQLYTNMGHYREAQGVHENNLRLVVEGDDGDDRTLDTMDATTARHEVDLLKQAFLRLRGWDKAPEVYKELIDDLKSMPEYRSSPAFKDVKPVQEWNSKETPSETLGKFEAPATWEIVKPEAVMENGEVRDVMLKGGKGRDHVKRATSNWGLTFVHNLLNGGVKQEERYGNGHGQGKEEEEGGYESAAEEVL